MDVKLNGCMKRLTGATMLLMVMSMATAASETPLEYLNVDEINQQMGRGQLTSVALVQHLLQRIERLDKNGPAINAIIELNPDALLIAQAMDKERKAGHIRGPLHGVPVLLKDNIDTSDQMQTTAGSVAMIGEPAAQDAFIVQRLRSAGAVILGKTNLSEWAAFRDPAIPSGWSGRGGQTKNPHLLNADVCGSSSGSAAAVAAGFAPLSIGTETSGSIICPASMNGVVGVKPTVGLLSRSGLIPVTQKLDTPGPMTRTVRDAALLLNALAGDDPADPIRKPRALTGVDYTALLRTDALVGKRIGYPAKFDHSELPLQDDPQFSQALERMQSAGATLIPVELIDPVSQRVEEAFHMGIKRDLPGYLATRTSIPARTLEDLLLLNAAYGDGHNQDTLLAAGSIDVDEEIYNELWQSIQRENAAAIDRRLATYQLDAIVSDVSSPAMNVVPLAGYPGIMLPSGMDDEGIPTSIFFFGPRWSDARLLALAYGYEQASQERRTPAFKP
ncbi:amidase family protein [Pseudomonas vancouverensis]|uniref:Amidase n=1 Tax=Pseudomonas vancouverensis TaxID=95300 RepID=A0A1H2M8Y5_PSEVA|nr:amidase family protein [Pseudomonas vancouverensis]KAB0498951.1 amidase [Pseudomonas vancouverensis]TDB57647.1 amidase [Pseudomonas vancouverensis]SDU89710.1 amidase [Pseudomonas vancouverensis]